MSITGQNMNIMDSRKNYIDVVDWKMAQFALGEGSKEATPKQLRELSKNLLKNTLSTWVTGGCDIKGALRIVIDWADSLKDFQGQLQEEIMALNSCAENSLINLLLKDKRTNCIYIFDQYETRHIWVTVVETSAQLEYEYSGYFADTVNSFKDFYADFMVFSTKELKKVFIPEKVKIVSRI